MHTVGLIYFCLVLLAITCKDNQVFAATIPDYLLGEWQRIDNPLPVHINKEGIKEFGRIRSGKFSRYRNSMMTMTEWDSSNDCKICFSFKFVDENLINYKLGDCLAIDVECSKALVRIHLSSLIRVKFANGSSEISKKEFPFWNEYEFSWKMAGEEEICPPLRKERRKQLRIGNGAARKSTEIKDNRLVPCDDIYKNSFQVSRKICNPSIISFISETVTMSCIAIFQAMHTESIIVKFGSPMNTFHCIEYKMDEESLVLKIYDGAICGDDNEYEEWILNKIYERTYLPKFMTNVIEWKSLDRKSAILKQTADEYQVKNSSGLFQMIPIHSVKRIDRQLTFLLVRLMQGCRITYNCLRIRRLNLYAVAMNFVDVSTDITDCQNVKYDKGQLFIAESKNTTCDLSFAHGVYRESTSKTDCKRGVKVNCKNKQSVYMVNNCKMVQEFKCKLSWKTKSNHVIIGKFKNRKRLHAYKTVVDNENLKIVNMKSHGNSKNKILFTGEFKYVSKKLCGTNIRSKKNWWLKSTTQSTRITNVSSTTQSASSKYRTISGGDKSRNKGSKQNPHNVGKAKIFSSSSSISSSLSSWISQWRGFVVMLTCASCAWYR